jgi:hypothetical protein
MIIGWIYFVFAWLSLFVINGIITFMLTPGAWLTTGKFWDAFFNPTFWPSLILRSCISVALAGLYSQVVAARCRPAEFRVRMVRQTAGWGLCGLAGAVPSLYWYWRCLPASVSADALPAMTTPIRSMQYSFWFAGAIVVLLVVFGRLFPPACAVVCFHGPACSHVEPAFRRDELHGRRNRIRADRQV